MQFFGVFLNFFSVPSLTFSSRERHFFCVWNITTQFNIELFIIPELRHLVGTCSDSKSPYGSWLGLALVFLVIFSLDSDSKRVSFSLLKSICSFLSTEIRLFYNIICQPSTALSCNSIAFSIYSVRRHCVIRVTNVSLE